MADNQEPEAKKVRYESGPLQSNATTSETKEALERPAAASHHNEKINLQSAKPQQSGGKPNVLELNTGDLHKMFDDMNLGELFSMAKKCKNLYISAKQHFRSKHGNFDFESLLDGDLLDVDKASKFLRIFGDQMHTMKISRDFFTNDEDPIKLLQSIADTCPNAVKVLTLDGFNFKHKDPMDDNRLKMLFKSIEMLTLNQCSMKKVTWCNMNHLKWLKMNRVEIFDSNFWEIKYNKLQVVEFVHVDVDVEELSDFIRSVPSLKRLSIVKCCNIDTSSFRHVKSLKNLEEFEYHLNQAVRSASLHRSDLLNLVRLKKLKVVKLNCDYQSVQPLLDGFHTAKIAIEHLELAHGKFDDATVQTIRKLETITQLKFNNMLGFADDSLVPIAVHLKRLEELHIKTEAKISLRRIVETVRAANQLKCLKIDANNFNINTDTYQTILTAVQNRADNKHLAIEIYGNKDQSTIPDDVLKGPNEEWLKVNTLDRNTNELFPVYSSNCGGDSDLKSEFDLDLSYVVDVDVNSILDMVPDSD